MPRCGDICDSRSPRLQFRRHQVDGPEARGDVVVKTRDSRVTGLAWIAAGCGSIAVSILTWGSPHALAYFIPGIVTLVVGIYFLFRGTPFETFDASFDDWLHPERTHNPSRTTVNLPGMCPSCGASVELGFAFCQRCGFKIRID